MNKTDSLILREAYRKGETLKNGATKSNRKYVDFVVSEQSLGLLFGLPDLDLIGCLGSTSSKEYENDLIDELIGNRLPLLKSKQTPIYVCPECGDVACGAITVKIEFVGDKIIWNNFAYENGESDPDFSKFKTIGSYTFNKETYTQTLASLKM